jgi:hypothetical protein
VKNDEGADVFDARQAAHRKITERW